jgi:hypothetical protein
MLTTAQVKLPYGTEKKQYCLEKTIKEAGAVKNNKIKKGATGKSNIKRDFCIDIYLV